jgi:ABC-type branched-subunit amino acid transport system ATPase component
MSGNTAALLQVRDLTKDFGGLRAVDSCSFDVPQGAIAGLIGPNGSGKTTTFNLITGFLKPTSGQIVFMDSPITGLEPYQVALKGVIRTFQVLRLFPDLSVTENLLVGYQNQSGENLVNALLHTSRMRAERTVAEKKAMELLDFLGLAPLCDEYVRNLGHAQQKLVDLGRALMMDPHMLLLDEPTAGINPTFINRILGLIRELREQRGMTVLLVEHDMRVIMNLCEQIVVLDHGRKIAEGTPEQVSKAPQVIEAYLGV